MGPFYLCIAQKIGNYIGLFCAITATGVIFHPQLVVLLPPFCFYPFERYMYKVVFHNQNEVYELFVDKIYQSDLYGFIEIEEYVFGEKSGILIDPAEEKLKNEFASVKRSFIPMHAIVRIDEVEKRGTPKVTESKGNVAMFPGMGRFNAMPDDQD
jgi:hypothetical protein